MIKERKKLINNSGATLVLVIICMLFVGIIAAVVLRLTVGNRRTIQSVADSSENFYSTETIVDDVKLYLKRMIDTAAAEAQADVTYQLSLNAEIDTASAYDTAFTNALEKMFNTNDGRKLSAYMSEITCDEFGADGKSTSDSSNAYISINDPDFDKTTNTLKGVVISFTDDDGYTSTIVTDFTFTSDKPQFKTTTTTTVEDPNAFGYEADRFFAIANGNVGDAGSGLYGVWKGNVYAGNQINLNVASGNMQIYSQYMVSKNDVNVKGTVRFFGLEDEMLKPDKNGDESDTNHPYIPASGQDNANIFANNLVLGILGGSSADFQATDARIYVKDDLSVDGPDTAFKLNANRTDGASLAKKVPAFYGLTDSSNQTSSAIVINSENSKVDLSAARDVKIAGTAYTKVPAVYGNWSNGISYYMQGESATYRSLQALYLVPGELLQGVWHNPMTDAEYNVWDAKPIADRLVSGYSNQMGFSNLSLTNDVVKAKQVKFTDGAPNEWYIYWDFENAAVAAAYFNHMYTTSADVMREKIQMLGSGYIKMPSSGIKTKGGFVSYDGASNFAYTTASWDNNDKTACDGYLDEYSALVSGLSTSASVESGDIYSKLINNNGKTVIAEKISNLGSATYEEYPVAAPDFWQDGHGATYTGTMVDNSVSTALGTYKLVIGNQFTFKPAAGTKYIIIAQNDGDKVASVEIESDTTFVGLIISEGDIKFANCTNANCLGNVKLVCNKKEVDENGIEKTVTTTEYTTEFTGLLNRILDPDKTVDGRTEKEDKYYTGTILMKNIFDAGGISVIGKSKEGTGDSGLTKIDTGNWSKY